MRFKVDRASLIVGSNLPLLLCFTLYLRAISPPPGAYNWRGDLTEGFLRYEFGGLTFGGAYTWRGLFSEFYGILTPKRELIQYDSPTCIAAVFWIDLLIL